MKETWLGIIDDAAIDKFQTDLRGQLLCPGDETYDPARKIWNGMFDRRPALIARCAGTADVIVADAEHGDAGAEPIALQAFGGNRAIECGERLQ